jgi:hypothetical protein
MNAAGMAGVAQCFQVKLIDPANASSIAALVASPDNLSLQANSFNTVSLPVSTGTDLASHVPGTSLFYLQLPNVGPGVHDLVSCLRTNAPNAFSSKSVQEIETGLGVPVEDGFTVLGDVGVSVGFDKGQLQWGLVSNVSDQSTAQNRLTALMAVIRLASLNGNLPATIRQSTVDETTVYTITLSGMAPQSVPVSDSISVALSSDGHLYLGGGDFVATALGMQPADSLASNDRYTSALAAAGNPNGITLYADIDGIRQAAEQTMSQNTSYTTDIQPYLKPFDRLIIGTGQNGTTASSQIVLFVK